MKTALAFAVLIGVMACGSYEQGQVTARQHHPERSWTSTEIDCTQGTAGRCWAWGWVTKRHHTPDRYLLTLAWSDQVGEFDVSAEVWSACQIGDMYPACAVPPS